MSPSSPSCIVLGGGGHASVVIDALQLTGVTIHGILDPRADLCGTRIMDIPVLGGDELLNTLKSESLSLFIVGIGSVKFNPRRRQLFEAALRCNLTPLTVIHPAAVHSKSATIAAGTVVLANAVVNAGAEVGMNVIINSGAVVEHGCHIGDHTHIATGARVLGDVRVGMEVFVGAGAILKEGIAIGDQAVIGAGAVVLDNVDAKATVGGVPARILNPQ
jgi:sugar O-acyltransferase (sialic acid O-acetyltransferase NeuD family)